MSDELRDFVRSGYFLLICLVFGFVLALYWFDAGHGASLSSLEEIRPGMSKQAVRKLLGNPTTVNEHEGGRESWFYTRATLCMDADREKVSTPGLRTPVTRVRT